MDVATIAFSAISLFQAIIEAYQAAHKVTKDFRDFDNERELFITRSNAEKTITTCLRDLLFARRPPSPDILFGQLGIDTQESLLALLEQFRKAILEYLPLEKRYKLDTRASNGLPLLLNNGSDLVVSNEEQAPSAPPAAETSWDKLRKLKWAIQDKKRAWDLLKEFELWNKKITQLVELQVLRFSTNPLFSARYAAQDSELRSLGISSAVEAYRVARVDPDMRGSGQLESHKLPWNELEFTSEGSPFKFGKFRGTEVIVDAKDMGDASPGQQYGDARRLDQLATILQVLADERIGLARCIGWVELASFGEWLILFEEPPGLRNPRSLLSQLNTEQRVKGPALEERFKLAYRICSAMSRLWSIGWVHKNLRSENILWFDREVMSEDAAQRSLTAQYLILGFEFSRDIRGFSDRRPDYKIEHNIYRHPNRQKRPNESFGFVHDIYAFGVLLLEIGLWRQVLSFGKGSLTKQTEPEDIKAYLINRAQDYLPYLTGSEYCDLVLVCLRGDFGIQPSDRDYDRRLVRRFRQIVEDGLRQLALPHLVASRYPSLT